MLLINTVTSCERLAAALVHSGREGIRRRRQLMNGVVAAFIGRAARAGDRTAADGDDGFLLAESSTHKALRELSLIIVL